MLLSVICPVLNGEKYIVDNIIKFFINSKIENKELLIVDGCSSDKTVDLVKKWCADHSNIKLFYNQHQYVPHALNLAIKESKGRYIARLDVHTIYPHNYFEECIELLSSKGAVNVGGTLISCGISDTGKSIAHCMSSIFGVGNSISRIKEFNGYVDSVAFGFWKKSTFLKIGYFNESFIKNQDEEHNFRILEFGGKIYQSASIKTKYYVRESIYQLIKQMFNYGYFKPKVLKVNKSRFRLRQIIPSLFLIYIITLFFYQEIYFLVPLILYIIFLLYYSANRSKLKIVMLNLVIYPVMHISYGLGFLLGAFQNAKD
tara:strand:- start:409 stop:1353 length:945 start_codon:yes stop_codon:yes gene_type:complete